jgi:hypothetical protein
LKQQLNTDKGPKTHLTVHDRKRVYVEDRPSSDDEDVQLAGKDNEDAPEDIIGKQEEGVEVEVVKGKASGAADKSRAE